MLQNQSCILLRVLFLFKFLMCSLLLFEISSSNSQEDTLLETFLLTFDRYPCPHAICSTLVFGCEGPGRSRVQSDSDGLLRKGSTVFI